MGNEAVNFEKMYKKHHQYILAYARGIVHDLQLAEDTRQEALFESWRRLPSLPGITEAKFLCYILTAARHMAIDLMVLRRKRKEIPLDESKWGKEIPGPVKQLPVVGPLFADDQAEILRCIEHAVNRLPPKYKKTFEMRFKDELTNAAVAKANSWTHGSTKVSVHLIRTWLKHELKALEEYYESTLH
jgi:RNA polymerase sigma factor (sigma-70 family)